MEVQIENNIINSVNNNISKSTENKLKEYCTKVFKIEGILKIIISYLDKKSYIEFKNTTQNTKEKLPINLYINHILYEDDLKILEKIPNVKKIEFSDKISLFPLLKRINTSSLNEIVIKAHQNIDYSPLYNIKNLKILTLKNDRSNINFIDNLLNLEELNIRFHPNLNFKYIHNGIIKYFDKDNFLLYNIKNLTKLKVLDISWMVFNDISCLSKLENLEELNLSFCVIIENNLVLSKFLNLKKLNLSRSNISDLSFISKLTELTELNLTGCYNIKNIFHLRNLYKLKKLLMRRITNNHKNPFVIDLSFSENLINLQELILNTNLTINHFSLSNLKKLKIVEMDDNKLNDINFLENLTELQNLSISHNKKIKNYYILSKLTKLQILCLRDNDLTNISFIQSLSNLIKLEISENIKIIDFNPISKLKKLKEINLWGTSFGPDISLINELFDLKNLIIKEKQLTEEQIKEIEHKNIHISYKYDLYLDYIIQRSK